MDNTTKTIKMMDGRILECPSRFIEVHVPNAPGESIYAGVVEARDHEKYNVPDFVFFSNRAPGCAMNEEEREVIFEACRKAWPKFKKVEKKTLFGCFSIPEEGGPEFDDPYFEPVYGAVVKHL